MDKPRLTLEEYQRMTSLISANKRNVQMFHSGEMKLDEYVRRSEWFRLEWRYHLAYKLGPLTEITWERKKLLRLTNLLRRLLAS